jgi:hypothetical protein
MLPWGLAEACARNNARGRVSRQWGCHSRRRYWIRIESFQHVDNRRFEETIATSNGFIRLRINLDIRRYSFVLYRPAAIDCARPYADQSGQLSRRLNADDVPL